MRGDLDDRLGRWSAKWVDFVRPRAGRVALGVLAVSALALGLGAQRLGIDSDEEALFTDDLPFVRQREEFARAFPRYVDPIVVVIDAPTLDEAEDAAERLAERLAGDSEHFSSVHVPGGGAFFEQHGLLYLELEDLEELADSLAGAQPYLAELSRDGSLRGFFRMLERAADAVAEGGRTEVDLAEVLDRVSQAVEAELAGSRRPLSWSEVILGQSDVPDERRRFVLVQPVVDFERVAPAEPAILALRHAIRELGLTGAGDTAPRARTTGVYVLSYEESQHVSQQSTLAGAASFVLVAILLWQALHSWRLVLASLATLLVGLALTAAFAAAAIGHLNLISVAFTVLFIGLSIDYALHLCVHYIGRVRAGDDLVAALRASASDVGGSLAVCAGTTAIGFYAFVPTAYRGVGELGLIAGTGMFVSLFCNLTFLPALIALWARPEQLRLRPHRAIPGAGLLDLPVRHPRAVVAITLALALGSAALVPRLGFDPNPLRLRDATTESVQTFNELLADGMAFPWNLSALAPDLERAQELAARIEALPSVDYTVTLADFVPADQDEKLVLLEDTAFLLGPAIDGGPRKPRPGVAEQAASVERLATALGALEGQDAAPAELRRAGARLRVALERFRAERLGRGEDEAALARLERDLVGSLPERLRVLRAALGASPLALEDLPEEVVATLRAPDGRMRVEVFPADDLNDNAALARYVAEVRSVSPEVFGEGVVILESGRAVVRAFAEALALSAALCFVLVLGLWRSLADTLLVGAPLALGALFTAGASVAMGIPLNFANVIVIPLLIGMGVDTGIHLVHRMRSGHLPHGNLLRTETARAVVFSALTTMASFGTLAVSSHPGMASLGQLLAAGITLILVCNLIVLPAFVALRGGARSEETRP